MGGIVYLRLADRVVRVLLAAQALAVIVLTVMWSAHVRGWISVKQLVAVFGSSAGWDLRFGLIFAFFVLLGCLLFVLCVLIVRLLLVLFGVPPWGLRWWVCLLAFQAFAVMLFASAVF